MSTLAISPTKPAQSTCSPIARRSISRASPTSRPSPRSTSARRAARARWQASRARSRSSMPSASLATQFPRRERHHRPDLDARQRRQRPDTGSVAVTGSSHHDLQSGRSFLIDRQWRLRRQHVQRAQHVVILHHNPKYGHRQRRGQRVRGKLLRTEWHPGYQRSGRSRHRHLGRQHRCRRAGHAGT